MTTIKQLSTSSASAGGTDRVRAKTNFSKNRTGSIGFFTIPALQGGKA